MMGPNLTIKDILADPHKFGVPTFEEYCAAPGKYKKSAEDMLNIVSDGPSSLRHVTKEMIYHIEGYKVKTLEKVQQIAKDHGWDMLSMDIKPDLEKTTNGRYIFHVHFVQKDLNEKTKIQG